jgi:hypothetical protein
MPSLLQKLLEYLGEPMPNRDHLNPKVFIGNPTMRRQLCRESLGDAERFGLFTAEEQAEAVAGQF